MKEVRIPVAEARKNLAKLASAVQSGARVKLTRYDKTLVAIISKHDLARLSDCEEKRAANSRGKQAAAARTRRQPSR